MTMPQMKRAEWDGQTGTAWLAYQEHPDRVGQGQGNG